MIAQILNPPQTGKDLKTAGFSLVATGTVVAAVPGRVVKVSKIKLICSVGSTVNWRSGAAANLEGSQAIAANGGYIEESYPPDFILKTNLGESLDLVLAGAAAGRVTYWDDDAF